MKNITSSNPLKAKIVNQMKVVSGGNKITQVQEDKDHYVGQAMKYDSKSGKYEQLGEVKIPKKDINA